MAADKKSTAKKLSKLGSKKEADISLPDKPVEERVPDWLRMLLGKYGEPPGKLIGLREEYEPERSLFGAGAPFAAPADENAAELSALLEQMAEDGPPEGADDRSATSVEWGSAAAAKAEQGPDDISAMLAGISTYPSEQELAPDYETDNWLEEFSPAREEEAYEAQTSEPPDWLDEVAPPEQPATDTQPALQVDDIPDWLSDALESPEPIAPEIPPDLEDFPETPPPDYEIPDWLTEGLDTPAEQPGSIDEAMSTAETVSEAEAGTDVEEIDIPDWLTSMVPPAAAAAAVETTKPDDETVDQEEAATSPADDLAAAATAFAGIAETEIDEADIPDWLKQYRPTESPAKESSAPEIEVDETGLPDWLTDADSETEAAEPAAADQPAAEAEPELSDWLSDLRATVPETEPEPEIEEAWWDNDETGPGEFDIPDWLADADGDDSESQSDLEQERGEPRPADLAVEPMTSTEAELEIPDWLKEPEEAGELPSLPDDEEEDIDLFYKSTDASEPLPQTAPAVSASAEFETTFEDELPDWLKEDVDDIETPPWLAENLESEAAVEDLTEIEGEFEVPDWLADEPAVPTAEAGLPADDSEEPDITLAQAAAVGGAALGMAALVDNEEDQDLPDWLAETADDETEVPDWLEPEADELSAAAAAPEADLEMPDWLMDTPPVSPPEPAAVEISDDIPDWLAETPVAPPEKETELPESAAESEMPDWLADIPQAPLTGPLTAPAGQGQVEAKATDELPAWLRNLPDLKDADLVLGADEQLENISGQDSAGALFADPTESAEISTAEVVPEWLLDLSSRSELPPAKAEPVEEEASADEAATDRDTVSEPEDEPETRPGIGIAAASGFVAGSQSLDDLTSLLDRDISAELPPPEIEAQADTLLPLPGGATPTEADQPDLSEETAAAEISESVEDAPDWLAAMVESDEEPEQHPEFEPEEIAPVSPGERVDQDEQEDEDGTELEFHEEDETPPWLAATAAMSSLGSAPVDEEATPPVAPLSHRADLPDWLSELPEPDEEEMDQAKLEAIEATPDWLANVPDADDEEDIPPWLANYPKADQPEQITYEIVEADTPDWLVDFTAQEEETEETDTADEPDWLAQFTAPESELERASPPTASDETASGADAPDWLTNLQLSASRADMDAETKDDTEATDWLSELSGAGQPQPQSMGSDEAEDYPDWLAELPVAEQPKTEPPMASTEHAPDWLSELPIGDTPDTSTAAEDDSSLTERQDTPDLALGLAGLDEVSGGSDDDADLPDWLRETSLDELETPDWLLDDEALSLKEEATATAASKPTPADLDEVWPPPDSDLSFDEESSDLPDWLIDDQEEDEDDSKNPTVSP